MTEFTNTLYNALFYLGDWLFVRINYFLLLTALSVYLFFGIKRVNRWWWISTLIATFLQILLWFMLNAQGISIIWNAISGMLLLDFLRNRKELSIKEKTAILFVFTLILSGNIYFSFITPLITTIAHISALFLGMILQLIFSLPNRANTKYLIKRQQL